MQKRLFSLCTGPYDKSPPQRGQVVAKQGTPDSITVLVNNFYDPDSDVVQIDVCVGTWPGGCNVVRGSMDGQQGSMTLQGMSRRLRNMQRVWVTAIAYNEDKLSTAATASPIDFDLSAPNPADLRVRRSLDGAFVRKSCIYGRVEFPPPSYAPRRVCSLWDTTLWTSQMDLVEARF